VRTNCAANFATVRKTVCAIASGEPADPVVLAAQVQNKDEYDKWLDEKLPSEDYASRAIDVSATHRGFAALAREAL